MCPRNKVSGEVLVLGENDASDRKRIATAAIAAAFIFIVSSLVFMIRSKQKYLPLSAMSKKETLRC